MKNFRQRLLYDFVSNWSKLGVAPGYLYQFVDEVLPQVATSEPVLRFLPNNLGISCDLRDHVQRQIWAFGCYEPIESFLFYHLIRPGQTILDIGANVGQYTLLASSQAGANGKILAFEPQTQNYLSLKRNLNFNKLHNVEALQLAAWDQVGELNLIQPKGDDRNFGTFHLSPLENPNVEKSVKTIVLDQFLGKIGIKKVDIIKMDIEGAEIRALKGLQNALHSFQPTIFIEVNRTALERMGGTVDELFSFFKSFEYEYLIIKGNSRESLAARDIKAIQQQNVIFYKQPLSQFFLEDWDLKTCLEWARLGVHQKANANPPPV